MMSEKALRILLVEDDKKAAAVLRKYLRRLGYDVSVANDAASARSLAAKLEFDLLLSDLALPDGDGWRLLQSLNSVHRIPGIAMSGYNTAIDVARSLAAGFVDHLAKPIAAETLHRTLQRAVMA